MWDVCGLCNGFFSTQKKVVHTDFWILSFAVGFKCQAINKKQIGRPHTELDFPINRMSFQILSIFNKIAKEVSSTIWVLENPKHRLTFKKIELPQLQSVCDRNFFNFLNWKYRIEVKINRLSTNF